MRDSLDQQLQLELQSNSMDTHFKKTNQSNVNEMPHPLEPLDKGEWTGAFNTSFLTTRAQFTKDQSLELGHLLKTPEFECLLLAAQRLAQAENISPELATERLICVFRKLDKAWKQVVISRGLSALIDQP